MSKRSDAVKRWRRRTKERIVESFGGKCCICGYNKSHSALALHHLNPSEKEISLASIRASARSWERIVIELRKCILVCHNCHSEIHDINCETEVPDNPLRFNESFTNYLRSQPKESLEPCPLCGKDKKKENVTCSYSCAAKLSRRVDWDNIDLFDLMEEFEGNFNKIANYLDISDVSVRKRWKKINDLKFNEKEEAKKIALTCPICGGKKKRSNKTCSVQCFGKMNRKVNWDSVDLASLVEELGSYVSVADNLGISEAAVRKRWKKIYPG